MSDTYNSITHKSQNKHFRFESLKIYDGGSDTSETLGEYCGSSIPNVPISSSNEMFIEFYTHSLGYYTPDMGFGIKYFQKQDWIAIESIVLRIIILRKLQ